MRRLCFVHPFKTGGTSLMMFLSNNFDYYNILPNDFFSTTYEYIDNKELDSNRALILSDYQLVMGHLPIWASNSIFSEYNNISMLRNPINRVVSRYYHLQATPMSDYNNAPKEQKFLIDLAKKYSLEELLQLDFPIIDFNFKNHQYKMLSSNGYLSLEAVSDAYDVIGCLEKLDDFMFYLSDKFSMIPSFGSFQLNQGNYNRNISESLIKSIKKCNDIDIELYNRVYNRW